MRWDVKGSAYQGTFEYAIGEFDYSKYTIYCGTDDELTGGERAKISKRLESAAKEILAEIANARERKTK